MNRKFFRFWLLALLWGPVNAWALEIGEIQVQSALNQLFDARIPLPTLTPEDLAKVSVKLAPPPMFNEFGLERAPTLANLVFSIEYNAEGQVYVRVVSTRPIREPSADSRAVAGVAAGVWLAARQNLPRVYGVSGSGAASGQAAR